MLVMIVSELLSNIYSIKIAQLQKLLTNLKGTPGLQNKTHHVPSPGKEAEM